VFFSAIAKLHPRFHTPSNAILLQAVWASVLVMFWGTFENLISYVVFADWIFFGLAGAAVLVLRARAPHEERPFRVLGYPLTPLFFTGMSVWFVLNTLIEKPEQAIAGLLFLALGVPVYYVWRDKQPTNQRQGT
jgi:APA family basic amino acid/polyamine antiporter